MPILRKLIFTMTAAAALLAAPSAAFASTASPVSAVRASATPSSPGPAATLASPGVTAAAPANPHCVLSIGKPRLVHRKAEVTATIKCRQTVTDMTIAVALDRNGHNVNTATGHKARGKVLTVMASKACRNHNRGSFTGGAAATVKYRGHIFGRGQAVRSGPVTLACGF
jgi:hypothetical protein